MVYREEVFGHIPMTGIEQYYGGQIHAHINYLCCHNKCASTGIYGDISSHQTNVLEFFIQLTIFLVAKSL